MTKIVPQPGIMEIALYQGGAAHVAGVTNVVKLSSNENPFGPSPRAVQAMQDAAELTPSGVVEALNAMDGVEIPGFVPPVEFGPDQHVASLASAVYAANPEDGDWQRVGDPVAPAE